MQENGAAQRWKQIVEGGETDSGASPKPLLA